MNAAQRRAFELCREVDQARASGLLVRGMPKTSTTRVRPVKQRPLSADPRLDMSEEKLEEAVRSICKDLGVVRVHHRDSRKTTSGWPDDVLVGPGGILFRELKRTGKDPTPSQEAMLAALRGAGGDVAVWRPIDLVTGRIAREVAGISRVRGLIRGEESDV